MKLIIDYAAAEGLKCVDGQVLRENTAMLQMCRELGFEVKTDHSEPDILQRDAAAQPTAAARADREGVSAAASRHARPMCCSPIVE